jgi:N-acyl-D-aspartate/D-glutamate deacylase
VALQVSQTVSAGALSTPAAITPSASDTIAAASFGPAGVLMRVITTGTTTNVVVLDPNTTASSNPGTPPTLAAPATGVRETLIPLSAIATATGVATVTFSGALTGVTYELKRV